MSERVLPLAAFGPMLLEAIGGAAIIGGATWAHAWPLAIIGLMFVGAALNLAFMLGERSAYRRETLMLRRGKP